MVEIELTKMSSKGQVVIPVSLRGNIKEGETLLLLKSGNQIILKPASALDKQMAEDLEFARRTEEAYRRHERGKFKSMPAEKFLEELGKW